MGALTRQYAEQNSKFAKPEHGQKRHAAQPRLLDANRRDVQHTEPLHLRESALLTAFRLNL